MVINNIVLKLYNNKNNIIIIINQIIIIFLISNGRVDMTKVILVLLHFWS